jgi:hypothetical protein
MPATRAPQYPNDLRPTEWQRASSGPKAAFLAKNDIDAHGLHLTNLLAAYARIEWEDEHGHERIRGLQTDLRAYERAAQTLATKIRGMRTVGSEVRVWLERSANQASTMARALDQLNPAPTPAFVPQHFTSLEWRDKISEKCLGQGVEAQLESWHQKCSKPLSRMTPVELVAASQVATLLLDALRKAETRCGAAQQGSKTSVEEYRKKVKRFQDLVKDAARARNDRNQFRTQLTTLEQIYEDKELLRAFVKQSEASFCDSTVKAWILYKERKYEEMVRTYGPENDYNILGPDNQILLNRYVNRKLVGSVDVQGALHRCGESFVSMLEGDFLTRTFNQPTCKPFNDYLAARFPIQEFHIV